MEARSSHHATSLGFLPLEKLLALAIDEELIRDYRIRGDKVVIVQDRCIFNLPRHQACTFLIGMLRGRSWYANGEVTAEAAAGGAVASGEVTISPRRLEATLDALLTFAKEARIIHGYRKDPFLQTATIRISACSTELSYPDAVSYLFDCVQHEVRALTQLDTLTETRHARI